ncbi:MAG: DICT sensory domain-containing protein [Chroococcales cyanobacterium]
MQFPPPSNLSLYELAQEKSESPPLAVTPDIFKSVLKAWINVLIDQNIRATLWVKLPSTGGWLKEIEQYSDQVKSSHPIYLCTKTGTLTSSLNISPMIPVLLDGGTHLKQEFFLIALSPDFCGLLIAKRQSLKTLKESFIPPQERQLTMLCSFKKSVIETVLRGIQEAISVTDTTPSTLLTLTDLDFRFPSPPNSTLLTQLLWKYIEQTQENLSTPLGEEGESGTSTASLRLKDEFLPLLVRELRTPLTHMKTALSLLASPQLKREQRQRYLNILSRECDRQGSLISGLQEIVQLDLSLEEATATPVNLQDMVPGIVSTYQPLAQEKGIQLGYTLPPNLPPIFFPSLWLKQIINLLSNSLKFTPPDGRVSVTASVQGDYVQLAFIDTGIGIVPNDLPKIFDSFYRGRSEDTEAETGAGLGLTLVQQLLLRAGGSISVTSKPKKGSTFKILLPIWAS